MTVDKIEALAERYGMSKQSIISMNERAKITMAQSKEPPLRSKHGVIDAVNWLGIPPLGIVFTAEEIRCGEIQSHVIGKVVVYLTRGDRHATREFKVTSWKTQTMLHREMFDDWAEAQACFTAQVRQHAVNLANEALGT